MRYRALSPTGDYVFGDSSEFLINSPDTVRQAIETKLKLLVGEWFLDDREGLDVGAILGNNTNGTRDQAVQSRILETPGVLRLASYSSTVDVRAFSVSAVVDTIYGEVVIQETF